MFRKFHRTKKSRASSATADEIQEAVNPTIVDEMHLSKPEGSKIPRPTSRGTKLDIREKIRGAIKTQETKSDSEIKAQAKTPKAKETIVDPEDYGLKQLVAGENPVLDIVAVHGLNGHREKTWTAENGVNWLKDLLPEQTPNARILSYGYDARTHAFESLSEQFLFDHAVALITELSLKRRVTKTERRPIIFVAHSLGGIVCKSALIYANSCHKGHNAAHKNVFLSTSGICFFGTPHQGGNGVSLGTVLVNVASVFANSKSNTRLLQHLEMHSEFLQQQTTQYNAISSEFETKFFYEVYQTETPIGEKMVVPKYSAVIPGAVNAEEVSINKDHKNMVRYTSAEDNGFMKVSQHLIIMADEAALRVEERFCQYEGYTTPAFLQFPTAPTGDPAHRSHEYSRLRC